MWSVLSWSEQQLLMSDKTCVLKERDLIWIGYIGGIGASRSW
jgi:hypothetical protein